MMSFNQVRRRFDKGSLAKDPDYDTQKYNCLICLQPATHPTRCHKCKLLACGPCSKVIIKSGQPCPKKCTQGVWQVTEQKPLGLELNCPFDKRCETVIYPETFEEHFTKCVYVPEEFKNLKTDKELKQENLCRFGHLLSFVGFDRIGMALGGGCVECSARVTRARCDTCNELYCCGCRYPKGLTTVKCPQGHPFLKRTQTFCTICDMCSKSVNHTETGFCYNQPKCDFAVCTDCFEGLEKEEKVGEYEFQQANVRYG